jgi:NTP hydrolase family protein
MTNGKRRGFFIGDGTGVGRGREIAGILLDNKQQGRTKHVWVSEKDALLNAAKRDWSGLGQPATEIVAHSKVEAGDDITAKGGILFTTYDTLKSAEQTKANGEKVRGQERVDQIVKWLGKDFDGVIAFDESNNPGSALAKLASARLGRRGWRRRWRPTVWRWRRGRASGCRTSGRRRR